MTASQSRYWRDPLFYAAMAAGMVFWLILFALTDPQPDPGWALREPLRFLVPALVYPVVEELVFRGLIQDLAQEYLKPWRLGPLTHANILTSLLFTALHFINHPPLWAAGVLAPSLVFGFFRERTAGLAAPIVLHSFYNSGYFLIFAQ